MKSKKHLYLHIGYPKTGTTSIQKQLDSKKNSLQTQGYLYPCTGKVNSSHHGYLWALTKDQRYKDPKSFNTLINELSLEVKNNNSPKTIISSEAFVFYQDISTLKEAFSSVFNAFTIVISLRNPIDWIYSDYNQGVKAHRCIAETFNEFVSRLISIAKGPLNYIYQIEKWAATFGHENIIVVNYDKQNTTIAETIYTAFELETENLAIRHPHRNNKSTGFEQLEYYRELNKKGISFKEKVQLGQAFAAKRNVHTKPFLSQTNKSLLAEQVHLMNKRYSFDWSIDSITQFVEKQKAF